jgi:hypothetical protein
VNEAAFKATILIQGQFYMRIGLEAYSIPLVAWQVLHLTIFCTHWITLMHPLLFDTVEKHF